MGVSGLPMAAVGRWLRSVRPERAHLRADLVAGLPGAISSMTDGMAAAVLAGVNPVQGLYSGFAGPIVGGLSSNTRMMVITTTSAAALAAGFFRGIGVGGSVGSTALNVTVGGKTRWATIWVGVWMLIILALFSGLVSKIAVPTLGAILIFAAIGSLRPGEVPTILRTGRTSQVLVITTFAATLFLPVAAAVGIGVALSLLLQLNQDAMDLAVVELTPRADGRFEEHPAPATLTSEHITILDVYGSLLYAGARTLQARLPDPGEARSPVVVLRLRRRTSLGATFIKVAGDYADQLAARGGRLYLTGLEPSLTERLVRTGQVADGPVRTFEATPIVGESTQRAYLDAEAWLVKRRGE